MSIYNRIKTTLFSVVISSISFVPIATAELIGLSLPLSGDVAGLGREFRTGANLAMEQYGDQHKLYIVDDGCDPDLAKLGANDLASQNPAIVTGFLCNEAAIVGANAFRESGVPVLVASARSVRLIKDRDREDWNLWRLSPGDDYALKATAKEIENRWKAKPYAVVDDGTIYGRTYTDGLRLLLNDADLEPQVSDNFRAAQSTQAGILRRLERTGVKAAFIAAATSEDLFTIAKNLSELKIDIEIILSEQLAVLPFLEAANEIPQGLKIIKAALAKTTGRDQLDEILIARNVVPSEQIYAGFSAIQVAIEALDANPKSTTANLKQKSFDTILGRAKFNADGANIVNPYKLHIWNGTALVLPEEDAPKPQ